jgi:cellobiose phosphorylase
MEKFGHFDETTKEYVVTTPICARPQENILYNDVYFSVIHQHGGGFSRVTDPRGYAVTIINGTEEPAHNTLSRIIYLRDDETGEYWSLGHYPVCKDMGDFECRMGAGSVTIRHRRAGIEGRWRIFVPAGRDPVEIWTLDIRDLSRRNRKLSLFSVAVLSLKGNFNSY